MAHISEYIPASQVVALLGIHPSNVHRIAKRGAVDSVLIHPGMRVYRKADVERLAEQKDHAGRATSSPAT